MEGGLGGGEGERALCCPYSVHNLGKPCGLAKGPVC